MLVLTRRIGETLLIDLSESVDPATPVGDLFADGPMEVAVLEVNGNQVRVGFEAPAELDIVRDELVAS
jgi:sRNA-binding carbon storage regulator CsrA